MGILDDLDKELRKANKGKLNSSLWDIKPLGMVNKPNNNQRDERRTFTLTQKRKILKNQHYKCAYCGKPFSKDEITKMLIDFDHIKPWSEGGRTVVSNGQALHKSCHKEKTNDEIVNRVERKKNNGDYWINPITGKKERKSNSF